MPPQDRLSDGDETCIWKCQIAYEIMTGANQGAMLERLPSVSGMGEAVPWSRLRQTMDSRLILSQPLPSPTRYQGHIYGKHPERACD